MMLSLGSALAAEPPRLQLEITQCRWPHLALRIKNQGDDGTKVLKKSNSWGWGIYSFEIVQADGNKLLLKAGEAAFTGNIPLAHCLPAGGQLEFTFNLWDGWWDQSFDMKEVAGGKIACLLSITESAEVKAPEYALGAWRSNAVGIEKSDEARPPPGKKIHKTKRSNFDP